MEYSIHRHAVPTARVSISALLLLVLTAFAAHGQDEKVLFPERKATVGGVMRTIQQQTRYLFAFENTTFDTTRVVLFDAAQLSVREALDAITAGDNYSYMVKRHFIVINSAPKKVYAQAAKPASAPERYRTDDRYRPSRPEEVTGIWEGRTPQQVAEEENGYPPARAAGYSMYTEPNLYARIQHCIPSVAQKVNVLYAAGTLTPNFGVEIGLTERSTLEVAGSWNQWNYIGTLEKNRKLNHFIIRPEYRWWFCERFDGHFLGAHAFYSKYNISQYDVPLLFEKAYRYEGWAVGAGLTYGYHWAFAKRWGIEFLAGVGVAQLKYKRYDCTLCSDMIDNPSKTYFGPTRLGISLVYILK